LRVTVGGGGVFSAIRGADFAAAGGLCFPGVFAVAESEGGKFVPTGTAVFAAGFTVVDDDDEGEDSPPEGIAVVAAGVLAPAAGCAVAGCEESVSDGELPPEVATLYTTTPIALRKRTKARIRRCR
jgi:hypothetical protein